MSRIVDYKYIIRNSGMSRMKKSRVIDLCDRGMISIHDIEDLWDNFDKIVLKLYLKKCLEWYRLDESMISCESPTLDL